MPKHCLEIEETMLINLFSFFCLKSERLRESYRSSLGINIFPGRNADSEVWKVALIMCN